MNNRIALLGHFQEYVKSLTNLGDHLDFYNRLEEPKRNKYVKDRFYESYFRNDMKLNDYTEFCISHLYRILSSRKVRTLVGYSAVVLGAPLYMFRWHKEARRFLSRHREALTQRSVAIFALGPLTTGDEKEWKERFSGIINALSKDKAGSKDIIIGIYLREGMFEEAFKHVLARRSLFTLSIYHKDLSERFPKRYFEAYKQLLIPFADSRMGRAHYREIVRYLEQMKRIKGFGEELRELVKLLKTKYANRPAFLDEIEGI